jgi:hypothetical protein
MRQQYQQHDSQQRDHSERQEFRNSHVALGAIICTVAPHLIRTGVALAPFFILDRVKDPTRANQLIKMTSLGAAGLNETLWALRVGTSREAQRHR